MNTETAVRQEMELRRRRPNGADESPHTPASDARQPSAREAELRREPPRRSFELKAKSAGQEAATAKREAEERSALQTETEKAALRFVRGPVLPLRGSRASLERQDQRLEAEGLQRIEDEADLRARIAHKLLVPLPVSKALTVNPALSPLRRYTRPWTARFLANLARAHEALFHRPLQVNSAVRTVAYQEKLMRINANAAPAEGSLASPHIMGATVDLAKKGMSPRELAWMRRVLLALEMEGKIDVEEEFEQACFHITVYKTYAPPGVRRRLVRAPTLPRTPGRSAGASRTPAQPAAAPSALMATGSVVPPGQ